MHSPACLEKVNSAVSPQRGRCCYVAFGSKFPFQFTIEGKDIEGIIVGPKVKGICRYCCRRKDDTISRECPFRLPIRGDCIHFFVPGANVDCSIISNGRRGGYFAAHLKSPFCSTIRVNSIQSAVNGTDIDSTVRPNGCRGGGKGVDLKGPF